MWIRGDKHKQSSRRADINWLDENLCGTRHHAAVFPTAIPPLDIKRPVTRSRRRRMMGMEIHQFSLQLTQAKKRAVFSLATSEPL
jgi:hypothetical protein